MRKEWFEWLYKDMISYFPENVSTFGGQLDDLFIFIYWISVFIFILTYALLIAFIVKYRSKTSKTAYYYHGNNLVELVWTVLPTFLFIGIGIFSEEAWSSTKYQMKVPKPDVEIDVMAYQFGWSIRYPGPDGVLGKVDRRQISTSNLFGVDSNDARGKDDLVLMNQIHLPINKNIVVNLSTVDVLHSFFLPHFRVKQDALPEKYIKVWFNGTKSGKYEIACAELCGSNHYAMRGEIFMYSQGDYDKWLDSKNKKISEAMANTTVSEATTEEATQ